MEVACEIGRMGFREQRDEWERSIDKTFLNNMKASRETYGIDIINCNIKPCEPERNMCINRAWSKRYDAEQAARVWRDEARAQNPFDIEPVCAGLSEERIDQPRRRRR